MQKIKGIIDIGSLKVKFIIGQVYDNKINIIHKAAALTCLGEGLHNGKGMIKQKPLKMTIDAINEYKKIGSNFNVTDYKVVATESFRRSENINIILHSIKLNTGFEVNIITQQEEAEIFFRAVTRDFQLNQEMAIIDMGGGSIQVLIGNRGRGFTPYFLRLGIYDMVQKFVANRGENGRPSINELNTATDYIEQILGNANLPKIDGPLIYGSSNIIDLFRTINIKAHKSTYSPNHPIQCQPDELIKFLNQIEHLTFKEREDKYKFQYGYMWGIQMAFLNAYKLGQRLGTNVIIPSNVNIAEGYMFSN